MDDTPKKTTPGFALMDNPSPSRGKGWGGYPNWAWPMPNYALLASNGHDGIVLDMGGPGISYEYEENGCTTLSMLGFDDAPAGLSVWEGIWRWEPGPVGCPEDGEGVLEGKYRPLNDEEWVQLRACYSLWDKNLWMKPMPAPVPK